MQEAMKNQGKTRAAITVQRFMKGYLVFRDYEKILMRSRLDYNAQYVKNLLNKLYEDA